jgi:hypothetical protein
MAVAMETPTMPTIRPRFGKMPTAVAYSGRSKSRIYEWAHQHPGLIRKDGASALVDFDLLDRILDALPIAEIKPQHRINEEELST